MSRTDSRRLLPLSLVLLVASFVPAQDKPGEPKYIRKANRTATVVATLKAAGLPALDGKWHYIGPFDNKGFETVDPPEKQIDLDATHPGKGETASWKEFKDFQLGQVQNLKKFKASENCSTFLLHEFESPEAIELPVSFGSDDYIKVWFNGRLVVAEDAYRAAAADQNSAKLKLIKGKNQLLIKIGNQGGDWAVYVRPELPTSWPASVRKQLERDYPVGGGVASSPQNNAEAAHYKIITLPVPDDIILEVGGLAMRPDGKLLCCTRRGDVWLIHNPNADDPADVKYTRFATGLHEALGLCLVGKDVYVVQRPELTKLVDKNGDDVADEYITFCDKWGVSGDYHEFAFGPARDKDGNFFVTLNVGFGGGHQAKAPWRGWCVKITPKGDLIPWATGLRSPNGVRVSPDNEVFYCDNQGEWVATNKMHHIRQGDNYGHQAGLLWVKQSPFATTLKDRYPSGMLYDGQAGKNGVSGMPPHDPPCIWFPYGRMGQSASEPIWDTTGGKFGPFAGQCFVGDQTKSNIMRVYLEKVNGKYQGASFPFRSGFQSGINRLEFGPDASLYAGQTNRGWGSVGGKAQGLQRLVYTGVLPFEIHAMKLTKTGFELTFTKPLDPATANRSTAYAMSSYTYNYWPNYGSPEEDRRGEKVEKVTLSQDRKSVSIDVPNLRVGRVYELNLDGIKSADGDTVLHPQGYYTLNELR